VPIDGAFGHSFQPFWMLEKVWNDKRHGFVVRNRYGGSSSQELFADGTEVAEIGAEDGRHTVGCSFNWGLSAFIGLKCFSDKRNRCQLGKHSEFTSSIGNIHIYKTSRAFAIRP